MESIYKMVDAVNGLLWGKNILVFMLIGAALYFSFKTKFMQFRLFHKIVRVLFKNEKGKKIKVSLEKVIKPSDLVAVGEFSKESNAKFEIKSKSYDNNFTATINKGIIEVESKKDVNPYTEEKFLMEIGKDFKGKIFCEGKEFNFEAEIQKQEQKKANSLIRN